MTDQNGKTTSYAYDDADRLTGVTDAASHVTNYAGGYPESLAREQSVAPDLGAAPAVREYH